MGKAVRLFDAFSRFPPAIMGRTWRTGRALSGVDWKYGGGGLTVIYLDLLLLLNFVANYLLLLITARMSGQVIRRPLLALAALLGAGYAAAPFLGAVWLGHPACRIAAGVLMVLTAFGRGRGLPRTTLIFFGASAALGGMVWAAELLGGRGLTLENGVLYSWVDIRLLLLLMILCYGVLTTVFDRAFRHRKMELVPVTVMGEGRTVELTALVDTGNTLTDPTTNRPVLVADGTVCRDLLPMEVPLDRPVEALEQLGAAGRTEYRLIPYRAVGVNRGLLLALRADRVTVAGRDCPGMLVALSPTSVSDGGGYQALIGGTQWI